MSRMPATRAVVLATVAAIPVAYAFVTTQMNASPTVAQAKTTQAAAPVAALLTPTEAGADPFFVEPRVPQAAGTPCVETIATNVPFEESMSSAQFSWTPSGRCTGPWAKIVLVVEMSGTSTNRREISAAAMRLHLNNSESGAGPSPGGGVLFMGSPQETDLVGTWRLERDVTEYADALTRTAQLQIGYGTSSRDNSYQDFDALMVSARSVKLLFYRASTTTPRQRTADVMRALDSSDFTASAGWTFESLPRNIEQVYLDVMARPLGGRVWYSCIPDDVLTAFPQLNSRFGMGDYRPFAAGSNMGCSAPAGSYREVEVYVDGQLAGLAPVFPWLPSMIARTDAIDYPAPSVQALNVVPFRVDLNPFAALLNDGQPHSIMARVVNPSGAGALVTGQVLLYLDKTRSVVTGALTRNTLTARAPTITDTIAENGDTAAGNITTFLRREYNIEGYVDTSAGRVRSTVYQVSRFSNTQTLRVVGDPTGLPRNVNYFQDYAQSVRLSNTVDRVSRRIRGTTLLSESKDYTTFPMIIDFANGGEVRWSEGLPFALSDHYELDVHQARAIRSSLFRRGGTRYTSSLSDVFDAARHVDSTTFPETNTEWNSERRYLFTDNRGSCYSAGLTTAFGELQTRTRGTECANGRNGIRWFAHPDGAPEALLWVAP